MPAKKVKGQSQTQAKAKRKTSEAQKQIARAKRLAKEINRNVSLAETKRARTGSKRVEEYYSKIESSANVAGVAGKKSAIAISKITSKAKAEDVLRIYGQYKASNLRTQKGRQKELNATRRTFKERYGTNKKTFDKIVKILNSEALQRLTEVGRVGTDLVMQIERENLSPSRTIKALDQLVEFDRRTAAGIKMSPQEYGDFTLDIIRSANSNKDFSIDDIKKIYSDWRREKREEVYKREIYNKP